jgi:hypothetical protein
VLNSLPMLSCSMTHRRFFSLKCSISRFHIVICSPPIAHLYDRTHKKSCESCHPVRMHHLSRRTASLATEVAADKSTKSACADCESSALAVMQCQGKVQMSIVEGRASWMTFGC